MRALVDFLAKGTKIYRNFDDVEYTIIDFWRGDTGLWFYVMSPTGGTNLRWDVVKNNFHMEKQA